MKTVQQAAQHFLDLYADEIAQGDVITVDVISEWWGNTKHEYDGIDGDAVEKAILDAVPSTQFHKWAKEVNTDWIGGYLAKASEKNLTVTLAGELAAEINSKFEVSGEDENAVGQLTFMTNR